MSETVNKAVLLQLEVSRDDIVAVAADLLESRYPTALGPIGPELMTAKLHDLEGAVSSHFVNFTVKEADAVCIMLRHLARGPLKSPTNPRYYQRSVEWILQCRPLTEWHQKGIEFLDSISREQEISA